MVTSFRSLDAFGHDKRRAVIAAKELVGVFGALTGEAFGFGVELEHRADDPARFVHRNAVGLAVVAHLGESRRDLGVVFALGLYQLFSFGIVLRIARAEAIRD